MASIHKRTTEVLHDIEVLQVEKLSNPRVVCKVVHGKSNHSALWRKTTGIMGGILMINSILNEEMCY